MLRRPLRALFRVAALLLAFSLLIPAGVGSATDPQDRLEHLRERIEETQQEIREAEKREGTLLDQIAASEQRRRTLLARVTELEAELAEAEAALAEVQAELDRKLDRLAYLQLRIRITNSILDAKIEELNRRASLTYQYGPGGVLSVLLGSDDFGDLIDRQEFLGFALVEDSTLVDEITRTREQVRRTRALVEVEKDLVKGQRDLVNLEVERIDGIRAEQQGLLDQAEAELAFRQESLEEVQDSKRQWERAVEDWQAESERIEALLQNQGSTGSGNVGGEFAWPTAGGIGSGFGWRIHPIYGTPRFHAGVDMGGACGQPIWAAEAGIVISAGYNGGYGYAVVIDHGNGVATLYAHQPYVMVSYGQSVGRGQQIGVVGSTGLSTACHLHFEVRINGTPVDPVPYIT
jgi:murein DD-endopeptidase MepM/ murein hydrolase activator NlpD